MRKQGKCQTCGDIGPVMDYNGTSACAKCLSMDKKGIPRAEILDTIISASDPLYAEQVRKSKRNKKRNNSRIRQNRP